jgi:hypothetical protein
MLTLVFAYASLHPTKTTAVASVLSLTFILFSFKGTRKNLPSRILVRDTSRLVPTTGRCLFSSR